MIMLVFVIWRLALRSNFKTFLHRVKVRGRTADDAIRGWRTNCCSRRLVRENNSESSSISEFIHTRRMAFCGSKLSNLSRGIHTTPITHEIRKLARLRVVDNSEIGKRAMLEGKPPRCIHVYNKPGVGLIGDKVLVAIKGEKKKGILVGLKQKQNPKVPKFDSNNLVLINEDGSPLGTRIHVPIPHILRTKLKDKTQTRGTDYTKLIAIASRFV